MGANDLDVDIKDLSKGSEIHKAWRSRSNPIQVERVLEAFRGVPGSMVFVCLCVVDRLYSDVDEQDEILVTRVS